MCIAALLRVYTAFRRGREALASRSTTLCHFAQPSVADKSHHPILSFRSAECRRHERHLAKRNAHHERSEYSEAVISSVAEKSL